jgi:hypothetical protein
MHLFRHQIGSGYLRKKLRVEIGDGGELNVLFNEFVKPGDEIWLAIPAGMQDSISVYENDELVKSGESAVWTKSRQHSAGLN